MPATWWWPAGGSDLRAEVRPETFVSRIRTDGNRATGVDFIGPDGVEHSIDARYVVVAGGGVRSQGGGPSRDVRVEDPHRRQPGHRGGLHRTGRRRALHRCPLRGGGRRGGPISGRRSVPRRSCRGSAPTATGPPGWTSSDRTASSTP